MKNIISLLLSISIVLSLLPTSISVQASTDIFSELKAKLPQGTYWNHKGTSADTYKKNKDYYNLKSTKQPCNHKEFGNSHCSLYGYSGGCGCNAFSGSTQCMGFARFISKQLFGKIPNGNGAEGNGWKRTTIDNLQVGDYIRYKRNSAHYGHSVMVTSVTSKKITVGECNHDGKCGISWNREISKSTLKGYYSVKCLTMNEIKKPAQPTIKSAEAKSSTSIEVKWDSVSTATSYKLGIKKAGNDKYDDTIVKGTSHVYNNLKANTIYYFRLYAVNSAGSSSRSVTFKTCTLTDTPKNVSISAGEDKDSQLVISWNKVSGTDYYKIERYRGDKGENKSEVIAEKVKDTKYTDKNLTANSKYWYKVYAVKTLKDYGNEGKRGTKTIKSAASSTEGKFTRISMPEITQNNSTPNEVTLKWTKALGGNTYQYKVWRQAPSDKDFKLLKTTSDLTYTDTSLKSGNVYRYKIETVTSKGNHCTDTGNFYITPKITKAVSVTPKSGTEMNVSWDKVASDIKISYELIRKENGKETSISKNSKTSYTDKGLKTNSTYSYYVKVQNSSGKTLTTIPAASAVLEILPKKITLNKSALSLIVNKTEQLTAKITPNESTSTSITWTSSDSSIAAVTAKGLITAKKAGTATIKAATANGKNASVKVTVVPDTCVYGEWIIDKEPTCTEEGYKYRVCSKHKEKEELVIEAAGHSYSKEMIVVKEASCTEEGEEAYVCSSCSDKKDITIIEKTEHSFGDWTVETAATCDESGLEYRECSLCGIKETNDIEMTKHDYKLTKETETTPDAPGSRTYTCSICQDVYTETHVPEVAEGEIRIGSAALKVGESAVIPVTISENPGITGFELSLEYDKTALKPTAINSGELLTDGLFMSTLDSGASVDELDEIKAVWNNSSAISGNGELFNITFEVLKDTKEGEYTIGVNYEKGLITDENFYDVMPNVIDNTIIVADVLMGDVNQDRQVDSLDNILLTKKIAKFPNIDFNENQIKAGNVHHDYDENGNPKINIKDAVRLSQLLAGYQFSETPAVRLMSEDNTNILIENIEAVPGEYISVPVKISANSGISGFKFNLDYDTEYLTPISISEGEILTDGLFVSNFDENTDISELSEITAYWNSADNMAEDGLLFTIDFLVSESAKVGQKISVGLTYDKEDICNSYLETVGADIESGIVSVTEYEEEENAAVYDYLINDAYIDTEDSEESVFPAAGNFDFTVAVQGEYKQELTPIMFTACYNKDGRLLSFKTTDLTKEILTAGKTVVHIDESKTDISEIKIFVWNRNNMMPLSANYNIFISE